MLLSVEQQSMVHHVATVSGSLRRLMSDNIASGSKLAQTARSVQLLRERITDFEVVPYARPRADKWSAALHFIRPPPLLALPLIADTVGLPAAVKDFLPQQFLSQLSAKVFDNPDA